jgi:hypothetical protein
LIHAIISTILALSVLAWFAIIAVFAAIMLACLVGGLLNILATPAALIAIFALFAFAAIPGVTAEDVFIVAAPGGLILILFISERQRLAERRAELSVSTLRLRAPARTYAYDRGAPSPALPAVEQSMLWRDLKRLGARLAAKTHR